MKEKFTESEWNLLKLLPFQIFACVAGADKQVDKKEIEELNRCIGTAALYKDTLHRELMIDIMSSDKTAILKEAIDGLSKPELESQMKATLKSKLTADEYQKFIASVFIDGLKVARSSGGSMFGRGGKISKEEMSALALFGGKFDLDLDSLKKFFG